MELQLRALGLNTKLVDGVIHLQVTTNVCNEGDTLTPEQCKLLELFEQPLASFKINVKCVWTDGEFEDFEEEDEGDEDEEKKDAIDEDED